MDLVDVLLEVLERDASDLHLTVGSPPIIRINGQLERLDYPRLSANDTRELIYSILSQDQRQRLENEWEIDFSYSVPGRARFRVNAYFQRNSLGAAFRLIPINIKKFEDLGLPQALHDLTRKPRGFCVVTGPTGSGKSTTLAAMIDEINETRDEHIMTIEDPIEFLHRHKKCMVNQREVGADTKSFNRALKSVLRQDPDIILVGEMRDTETMGTALTAAEHRPHHRRVPAAPAGADPRAAQHHPHGGLHAATAAHARRSRPLRGLRDPHPDPRGPQPHPRGQDAPDRLGHADRQRARHADHGRVSGRPRAPRRHHARAGQEPLEHAGGVRAAARRTGGLGRRPVSAAGFAVKADKDKVATPVVNGRVRHPAARGA